MLPINDAPPPGVVDRRDGNTKGERGITTVNCLFCQDQISASSEYVKNFDTIKWANKASCQIATCPFWGEWYCWQREIGNEKLDPKKHCEAYLDFKKTGSWEK